VAREESLVSFRRASQRIACGIISPRVVGRRERELHPRARSALDGREVAVPGETLRAAQRADQTNQRGKLFWLRLLPGHQSIEINQANHPAAHTANPSMPKNTSETTIQATSDLMVTPLVALGVLLAPQERRRFTLGDLLASTSAPLV
jgi:hypothetical protein